jgi:hypothetical protein
MSLKIVIESLRMGEDPFSVIPPITDAKDLNLVLPFYISAPCFYNTSEKKNEQGLITLKMLQDLEDGTITNLRPVLRKWPDDISEGELESFFKMGLLRNPLSMILSVLTRPGAGGQQFSPMQLLVLIRMRYWLFGEIAFKTNLVLRQDKGL